MSQKEHSAANKKAWEHRAYEAWNILNGTPAERAAEIQSHPEYVLRHTLPYHPHVDGEEIAVLLGSHGRRAIALALLGAEVTVVDISEENRCYALETAASAGVELNYINSDLLEWDTSDYIQHFDLVIMELGILHYFVDLKPLFALVERILKAGGRYVLHDTHPFSSKMRPARDVGPIYVQGDYFDSEIIMARSAPYASFAFDEKEVADFPLCANRYFTMGEIVSAVVGSGLAIQQLAEQPHGEFKTLPGTFILVAQKGSQP